MDENNSLETLLAHISIQFIEIIFYYFLHQILVQSSFKIVSLFSRKSLKKSSTKSLKINSFQSNQSSLASIHDQSALASTHDQSSVSDRLPSVATCIHSIPSSLGPISSSSTSRKTLVLDLDETLIHSTTRGTRYDFMVEVMLESSSNSSHSGIGNQQICYYVYKRPHLDYFLSKVSEWFTLVIFTASVAEYADPVIDWLDSSRTLISKRYFRENCTPVGSSYMKDLSLVEKDLSKVCLLDNTPFCFGLHAENGIPIDTWTSDRHDESLLDLLPFLDALRFTRDVPSLEEKSGGRYSGGVGL